MEIRCDSNRLFGIIDGDTVEFSCRTPRCGYEPGVVVLHRFSVKSGQLLQTRKYKNARRETSE